MTSTADLKRLQELKSGLPDPGRPPTYAKPIDFELLTHSDLTEAAAAIFDGSVPLGGCRIWMGTNHPGTRYGEIEFQGFLWVVHRLAFTASIGPIPFRRHVKRTCGQPLCVRSSHLTLSYPYPKGVVAHG